MEGAASIASRRHQARVAKRVDAGDLKSPGESPCGFESRPGYFVGYEARGVSCAV